jgi:amidohydrolase
MTGLGHEPGLAEIARRNDQLRSWLDEHGAELVAFRRNLHAHPELSRQEFATTDLVAERLELAGLAVRRMSTGTGLIADLVHGDGPTIVLRADLDALAMDDEKQVPYASQVPGVAHACGHDVHTAVVLGVALHLAHHPSDVKGNVRFVFQPAEEQVPGGALDVLADGALDGAEAVVALHCEPKLDAGVIAVRDGAITSAADSVTITLRGPGGHTARPELTVDIIAVAADLVAELPRRVRAAVDGHGEVKLVFGAVHAGDASNVIPTHAMLRASVRTPSVEVWEQLPRVVTEAIDALVAPSGATHEIAYVHGVPPVVNDVAVTDLVRSAAHHAPSSLTVVEAPRSWGGDDFAWLTRTVPGSYVRLGVHDARWGPTRLDLHAGLFDVDEQAIGVGVELLVGTVHQFFDRTEHLG